MWLLLLRQIKRYRNPLEWVHRYIDTCIYEEEEPSMCHLGRTRREKDEGGGYNSCMSSERMKHGSGIKDREDKSSGIEILIAEVAKINHTEPLRLDKQAERRKRN
jgi:hypothetical protein